MLIAGWLFVPDPGPVDVTVSIDGERAISVGRHMVRMPRPDVLEALSANASAQALSRNRHCGFLAFAPCARKLTENSRAHLVLAQANERLTLDLDVRRLTQNLDPETIAYLKHHERPVVDLLRGSGPNGSRAAAELALALIDQSPPNHPVEGDGVVKRIAATLAWFASDAIIFSEASYLASNPDVGRALAEGGAMRCAYEHWVRYGAAEGRAGFPDAQRFPIRAETRDAALGLYWLSEGAPSDAADCLSRAMEHFCPRNRRREEDPAQHLLSRYELSLEVPEEGAVLALFSAGLISAARGADSARTAEWFRRLARIAALSFSHRAYPDRMTDIFWWCEFVRELCFQSSRVEAGRSVALAWSNRVPEALAEAPSLSSPPAPTERFVRCLHLLWAWWSAQEGQWLDALGIALTVNRELFTFRERHAYRRTRKILANLFAALSGQEVPAKNPEPSEIRKFALAIREIFESTFGKDSLVRFDAILGGFSEPAEFPTPAEVEAEERGLLDYDLAIVVGVPEGESKRYRVVNVVDALRERGLCVATLAAHEAANFFATVNSLRFLVLFRCALAPEVQSIVRSARSRGARVLYDMDDLFFRPDLAPLIRGIDALPPSRRADAVVATEVYRSALLACDGACLSTEFLAEQARALGVPSFVLPNSHGPFERQIADVTPSARTPGEVWIAYFSGTWTHQVDFQACEEALRDVMKEHPETRFLIVGHLTLGDAWNKFANRIRHEPYQPHALMLRLYAGVDISLAPLEIGNPYCEAKSELKIFEAGLFGVPTVASDTEPYRDAVEDGSGLLARTPEDFRRALRILVRDGDRRRAMGAAARERALQHFSDGSIAGILDGNSSSIVNATPSGNLHVAPERATRLRICVMVPDASAGSGGFRSVFRLCRALDLFGHSVILCLIDSVADPASLATYIRDHFGPFAFTIRRDPPDLKYDVIVATFWTTVRKARRLAASCGAQAVYFVQDFEPWFYPLGNDYFEAVATYNAGLPIITYTRFLKRMLKEEFDLTALHVDMVLDRSIYYPRPEVPGRRQKVVHLARPEMPRRCFPTCARALGMLKALRPDVEIVLFGSSHIDASSLGFECQNLGIVSDLHQLARLYSEASLGLSISPTNPSHVPFEMLACGLPVVDFQWRATRYNDPEIAGFITHAEPDADQLLDAMLHILDNPVQARARARSSWSYLVRLPGEIEHGRQFERVLLALGKQRVGTDVPGAPRAERSSRRTDGRVGSYGEARLLSLSAGSPEDKKPS